MTAVVGLEHNGVVYIGADSAGTNSILQQTVRADEKVFANDEFVMGFTSSFRMGQLLRYRLSIPSRSESEQDDFRFMCTEFVDAVRQCLKDGGFASSDEGRDVGGTFLVGYRGSLYCVDSDFQVAKSTHPFMAIGCGDDLALGAMAASPYKDPLKRIQHALEIAEEFSAGVKGPFVVAQL